MRPVDDDGLGRGVEGVQYAAQRIGRVVDRAVLGSEHDSAPARCRSRWIRGWRSGPGCTRPPVAAWSCSRRSDRCRSASSTSAAARASWPRGAPARRAAARSASTPIRWPWADARERGAQRPRRSGRGARGHAAGRARRRYPLVLANLVAAVLVELAGRLAAHLAETARCWRAGSSSRARPRWRTRCAAAGLSVDERRVDGEWVTLATGTAGMTVHRFFVAPDDGSRRPLPAAALDRAAGAQRASDGRRRSARAAARRRDGGSSAAWTAGVRGGARGAWQPASRGIGSRSSRHCCKGDALEEVVRQGTEIGVVVLPPRRHAALRRARAISPGSWTGCGPSPESRRSSRSVASCRRWMRRWPWTPAASRDGAARRATRRRRLRDLAPPGTVIIGPEGGFSAAEVASAAAAGVELAGLGPRILRSRTVAAAAAAAILYRAVATSPRLEP